MASTISTSTKAFAILALCLTSAACHDGGVAPAANLESSVQPQPSDVMALATTSGSASFKSQFVAIPDQAVASIKTHDFINGFRQDIVFAHGPFHAVTNGMTLIVRTSRQETLDESVPLFKPDEAGIRSEIGAQFPHVPMQIVERESHNTYGPYGLALGRAGGDVRCLYAWQYIDENRLPSDAGMSGPIGIRVRLCESGTTFDAMAHEVDQLIVGPNAIPQDRIAQTGTNHIIVADETASQSKISQNTPPAHRHRKTAVAQHKTEPQDASPRANAAQTGALAIPAPTTTSSMPASTALSGDLPAEAYLGPKRQTASAATTR